jgi:transglutaminase-like putative cysteine protease
MIYDVRLVTSASYQGLVPFARHVLRIAPVDRPGQIVHQEAVEIEPAPLERIDGRDFFGNRTIWSTIETAHAKLVVRMRARIEVRAPVAPPAMRTPPWETVRAGAAESFDLAPDSPVHFLFPSRHVALSDAIGAYAGRSFPAGRSILDGALDLMRRIHLDFAYVSGATDVSTPAQEAFANRRGVCQDFAHVMIAGLRWLGLPAAYVSGVLRTVPPLGQPRLDGADATHAWVSVWCGTDAGWVGLDPTNALIVGDDHVVLGVGRDYGDVAPLDGVVLTHGAQHVDVAVDVAPIG